ncbi:MAG: saccharopine dehydrogenase family protein [Candidatus Methylomirabilales bacterium]
MADKTWMIYGAYGYTGALVSEEALRRGHRPVLAGRSPDKLAPLAERLGLDYVAVHLQDEVNISKIVEGFDLVFHAAGPFIHTSAPMVRACLKGGTHYVDITGEVAVFERNLSYDEQAHQQGITLMSGVGFDVIPTDCMAKYVADRVVDPILLELAIASTGSPSAGTIKTMLEHIPNGTLVRRDGHLVGIPSGTGGRRIRFVDRERTVLPATWGDLATAYRTTGIPNITTFMAFPDKTASLLRRVGPLIQKLLATSTIRRLLQKWVEKMVHGPDEHTRQTARSYLWARAANEKGDDAQVWLETLEGYQFTAVGGVRCVERILAERPQGALTPALAFGADFVLEVPGTKQYDRLTNL